MPFCKMVSVAFLSLFVLAAAFALANGNAAKLEPHHFAAFNAFSNLLTKA